MLRSRTMWSCRAGIGRRSTRNLPHQYKPTQAAREPPMIYQGTEPKEFFVWVDPSDWMVKNNIGMVGGLSSEPPAPDAAAPEHLMFVHNPNHKQGFVSRFH